MFLRFLLVLLVIVGAPCIAQAEKRVALIIGNGGYAKAGRLANPTRDAEAIAALLQAAKFDVVQVHVDLGLSDMRRALRNFADRVATLRSQWLSSPGTVSR